MLSDAMEPPVVPGPSVTAGNILPVYPTKPKAEGVLTTVLRLNLGRPLASITKSLPLPALADAT